MKKTRNEQGITLIALVITIIVMLVLVGVSINAATNGGLFDYAAKAAKETESKKQAEQEWATIEENTTTVGLIEKFTTDKEKDLEQLKLYFEEKLSSEIWDIDDFCFIDNDIIPDASTSVILYDRVILGDYTIIKYHNNLYKVLGEDVEIDDKIEFKSTEVQRMTKEEEFTLDVIAEGVYLKNINDISYYKYNGVVYKLINNIAQAATQEESNEARKVTISFDGQTIILLI